MERPSFKAKAVFEAILEAILTLAPPPGASKINQKSFKMGSNIEAFFETRFEAILKPPGRLFGLDVGSLLGLILEPRARSAILAKIEPAL